MRRGRHPDARNLTPLRAVSLLKELDEGVQHVPATLRWTYDQAREALRNHVRYGLRAKRQRAVKRSR